jgi:hypothetical protein
VGVALGARLHAGLATNAAPGIDEEFQLRGNGHSLKKSVQAVQTVQSAATASLQTVSKVSSSPAPRGRYKVGFERFERFERLEQNGL